MNPSRHPVPSSPASRFRGDSARGMMIRAVIISSGREIWWRRREVCSRPARTRKPAGCSHYLQRTQQSDGHWSQNMWLDGSPYWNGIQMDETALPILLVDLAHREKALAAGRSGNVLADGKESGRVSGAQRPGQPTGSLGGRSGLFAVHSRGGNCGAAGCGGNGRFESRSFHRKPIYAKSPMSGMIPSSAGCICPVQTGARNLRSKAIISGSRRRQPERRCEAVIRIMCKLKMCQPPRIHAWPVTW